jgi:hypothetical protein
MLLGFVPGLCLAADPAPLEVDLRFEQFTEEDVEDTEGFLPDGRAGLEASTSLPQGDWKLPKLESKLPVYALAALGDEKQLLVLDCRKRELPFYDTLYLDANGNGDLGDDKPIEAPGPEEGISLESNIAVFPIALTKVKVGGKELPHALRVFVSYAGTDLQKQLGKKDIEENLKVAIGTQCCFRGEVKIAGKTYLLALADGNTNGRFDDPCLLGDAEKANPSAPLQIQGDCLLFTDGKKLTADDWSPLGDLLSVGDSVFQVRVQMDRKKLELKPSSAALSPVKMSVPVKRLTLFAEDGKRSVTACRPGDTLKLPAGKYLVAAYRFERKDAEGDIWSISAVATGDTSALTAGDGGDGTLAFGEPYVAYAWVPERAYEELAEAGSLPEAPIDFRLEGKAREVVTDLRHLEGEKTKVPLSEAKERRPKEPMYRIVKTTGEQVAQGSFTYG